MCSIFISLISPIILSSYGSKISSREEKIVAGEDAASVNGAAELRWQHLFPLNTGGSLLLPLILA